MSEYNHKKIEKKWQAVWEKKKIYCATHSHHKQKFYGLIEFPYPSGDGLHVGHIRSNTAMDIITRKRRMEGFEVLYPIGWDAFGLPTENYAIKTGIHPIKVTKQNTDNFRRQLKALGFGFDWSREINTTDPEYYRWTQWIFLKFLEKGLAYKKKMAINWCPKDKTGLANEEVVDGKCERCGTPVEKREKEQWMLAITKYADRLLADLRTPENLSPRKVLIGTRNPAKIQMIKNSFAGISGIKFVSLDDLDTIDDSDLKEGGDFLKNATKKSEYYFKKTGLPTISTDHILWIKKWKKDKGYITHIRKVVNPKSDRATDEEVLVYLKAFVAKVGPSPAHFVYAISFTDERGTFTVDQIPHEYILQSEQAKTYWPGYPIEALLRDVETSTFKSDQPDHVRYEKIIRLFRDVFAPRMLLDHAAPNYLERIRLQQENWIGRSEGAEISFKVTSGKTKEDAIKVFTTRPDTLYGVTYLVLAPEHPLVQSWVANFENKDDVFQYILKTKEKNDTERTAETKEKTGVQLKGIHAVHPATGEDLPVFVADYVLGNYGTGAIMAVPAHDERDFEFAKKNKLQIKNVIAKNRDEYETYIANQSIEAERDLSKMGSVYDMSPYTGTGTIIWSQKFDGLSSDEAKKKITEFVGGKMVTTYKLRDWVFSRQRYWGEPIPVVHCATCGIVPVPEKDLPVKLPVVKNYKPTDTGESPLAAIEKWVNTKCPRCKGKARRETDTMPNWAGSSWYYLRYADPKNKKAFAGKKELSYFTPVDWYNGGMEHTTLHLLYSRFWHKFLYDLGVVPTKEPYQKRTSHGLILAEGGVKMSKSKGNVINPDALIDTYGADTLRLYEMFMGPFDQPIAWNTESMIGPRRFIERVWKLQEKLFTTDSRLPVSEQGHEKLESVIHRAIKKVTEDIEAMRFNTAVSALMVVLNQFESETKIPERYYKIFLLLLAPFIPHVTEELWTLLGNKISIHLASWPTYNSARVHSGSWTLVIQVNGKVRGDVEIEGEITEAEVKAKALMHPDVKKWLDGKTPKKIIYVPRKLVSIVIG